MTERTRTLVLDADTGALSDGELLVFIIPREFLINTAEE